MRKKKTNFSDRLIKVICLVVIVKHYQNPFQQILTEFRSPFFRLITHNLRDIWFKGFIGRTNFVFGSTRCQFSSQYSHRNAVQLESTAISQYWLKLPKFAVKLIARHTILICESTRNGAAIKKECCFSLEFQLQQQIMALIWISFSTITFFQQLVRCNWLCDVVRYSKQTIRIAFNNSSSVEKSYQKVRAVPSIQRKYISVALASHR